MAVRRILQVKQTGGDTWEDAFLRRKASPVMCVDSRILSAIEDLHDTLWAYPFCKGLSGPQIGLEYAITIVNLRESVDSEDLILINPVVISTSGKKDKKRESCMSVWGKTGDVERREKLVLEYLNTDLIKCHLECKGSLSRTIQHEIDHLQGIIYIDKLVGGSKLQHADFFDSYDILGAFIDGGNTTMG